MGSWENSEADNLYLELKSYCVPQKWCFGWFCFYSQTIDQAQVVQTLDSGIHRMKIYSLDNAIGFFNTYPLDGDLSGR